MARSLALDPRPPPHPDPPPIATSPHVPSTSTAYHAHLPAKTQTHTAPPETTCAPLYPILPPHTRTYPRPVQPCAPGPSGGVAASIRLHPRLSRQGLFWFFFFIKPAPTEFSPLPFHDAFPI